VVNLNTLDLNLLRVFDAMMRERSVSATAHRLGVSQPTVSNALNRLRSLLGDDLFVRTRHGMEPTAFALRLGDPVQEGLASIRAGLSQTLAFEAAQSDRTFNLLMNDVGAASFLPLILAHLRSAAPSVNLAVSEPDHADYEDALDSGAADLAIGRVKLSASFRSRLVLVSTYVVLLRPDHPLLTSRKGQPPQISFESYLAAAHVVVNPRGATDNPVERALAGHPAKRRIALTVPHATSLANVLPGSDLVGTVPDRCVDFLCHGGNLACVALPLQVEPNYIYQWWHKRHDQDAGHRWLRDAIFNVLTGAFKSPG
jgi:DNA-binding transcriptional LysR family regulator